MLAASRRAPRELQIGTSISGVQIVILDGGSADGGAEVVGLELVDGALAGVWGVVGTLAEPTGDDDRLPLAWSQ
jgi:hypothetical protein